MKDIWGLCTGSSSRIIFDLLLLTCAWIPPTLYTAGGNWVLNEKCDQPESQPVKILYSMSWPMVLHLRIPLLLIYRTEWRDWLSSEIKASLAHQLFSSVVLSPYGFIRMKSLKSTYLHVWGKKATRNAVFYAYVRRPFRIKENELFHHLRRAYVSDIKRNFSCPRSSMFKTSAFIFLLLAT